MAKELTFVLEGKSYAGQPVKLEREKIYGRSEIIATDPDGKVCTSANLDPDGTLIVPAGALKAGLLNGSGEWVEKSELRIVDENGQSPPKIPSSFDVGIALSGKASREEFLDHIWKSIYQLDIPELAAAVGSDIYAFPFSYRGGYSADDGFLLAANGKCWLFTGEAADFPFIGIGEEGVLEGADPDGAAESDEIDFDMM